ncbi:nucleotidyltransferase [Nanobdella aerobiophila]|uniref:Nucleotidyltransferase n=1 Tax=Nanobdella aerobiophila TaxID=2586965 RepID=A0A915SS98_9ARCH|nr:nucleotidyltransferase domain-containing protein [Nanobdella aerobiophila]BBL45246.1 nucleotidyltransferase [Nanobdella aerobiophila]
MNDLEIIKKVIYDVANEYNIKIDKIILFGSRARGDYREDSDYDILIITEEKIDYNIINDFWISLFDRLTDILHKDIDLILIDKKDFEKKKIYRGFVYYWAEKEGILIK